MATTIGSAYVQILPSTEGIGSKLQEALRGPASAAGESAGQSAGSKLGAALSGAAKLGGTAIAGATTAMVAFGTSAVKTGSEFDSSMSQIAATLGLTMDDIKNNVGGAGDTFQALRDKAQEMGASTNFSASEAAEGLNILAMSGFDAEQSMDMVEDVLHLAAAGSMDMASAAGYVSGAMKGFNDETKDSGYYADLMAKGATLANTSVAQLGDAMASGAAGAAAYGQTADSMTVSLLRLAEQGDVGAAAGTALAAAMKDLYTPSVQGADALKELGVAAYDSDGKARDFNDVVNDLAGALEGMSAEEANAYKQTIFGIQGLNAYNKMTVTGIEKQEQWTKALKDASEGAGEAAKQYDTMTDNLEGDMARWESSVDGLKIAVADELMPTIRDFVQFGSDSMAELTAAFKENGLSGAMEALGGAITKGIQKVMKTLPDLANAGVKLVEAIVSGIGDSAGEIGDAAVGIASTLIRGLGKAAPSVVKSAAQIVLDLALSLTDPVNIRELINAAVDLAVGLADGLVEAIPEICTAVPVILYNLAAALIEAAPRLLYEVPHKIGETIGTGLRNLDWKDIGQKVIGGLKDAMTNFANVITGAVEPAADAVTDVGEAAEETGTRLGAVVSTGTIGRLRSLKNEAEGVGDAVRQWGGETKQTGEFIAWTDDVLDDSLKTVKNATDDYEDLQVEIGITADEFMAMRDRIDEYTKELGDLWRENYEDAYSSMQGQIDLFADMKEASDVSVQGVIDNLLKQADAERDYYDNLKTVLDGAKEHGIQINAELQAELESGSDNIKLIVAELADNMEAENVRMLEDLNDAYSQRQQVSVDFARLCAGDYEEVKRNAALMRHELLELVRSTDGLYDEFHAAGAHAAQGLLDGWNSLSASATAAVGSTANSMVRRAHSILQEQSPSKVFREIGAYAVEGLTLGLLDEAPNALDTMDGITSDLIRATAYNAGSAMTYQSVRRASPPTGSAGLPYTSDTVEEMRSIRTDLQTTLEALRGMKIVMDTGETVGVLTSPMDRSLGNQYTYARRGI